MKRTGAIIVALLMAVGISAQVAPTLSVTGGKISGTYCQENPQVAVYMGVPYAAPPTGELRWKKPQAVVPWTGVRACDRFGAASIQEDKGTPKPVVNGDEPLDYAREFYADGDPVRSEDCLYLNVYTTSPGKQTKKPVMVWIHGGAYINGWGHEVEFLGGALALKGVVLVTLNYRLGILGFLAHPALTKENGGKGSGNYGLFDQLEALKWVKANIAQFGGDPDNVTLFGQSAGAGSVQNIISSPLSKGLVHRAIIQSGGGLNPNMRSMTREEAEKGGRKLMAYAGCKNLGQMRHLPANEMVAILKGYQAKYPKEGYSTRPIIDGELISKSLYQAAIDGETLDIPYMIGFTTNDFNADGLLQAAIGWSLLQEKQQRPPTYVYNFDYKMPGDGAGAFHSAELWFEFGTLKSCWRTFPPEAWNLSEEIMTYWTNFARMGDPNGHSVPQWRPYTSSSDEVHRLQLPVAKNYEFQNVNLPDEKRIDLLLGQLTTAEKISLLSTNLGVPRLGIPSLGCYEGLHGIALGGPAGNNAERKPGGGMVRHDLPTTIFPQAYGLGETWDREAVRLVGNQMAEEARYYITRPEARRKGLVVYAPNADLARDPRWGRTEESYGEDPYLTAQLSVAMVKGLQGDHPRYWKAAALMKHFLANSNEDGRDSTSSDFSERLFREYYSYPFYKGITEGGSRAFMASYNAWNGTPMCIHPCLEETTRKEWGNQGIICTDGGAMGMLVTAHKTYKTRPEAAAAVIKAGCGQILEFARPAIEEALKQGLVSEADIDHAIRGNLFVALKLGMLDGPSSPNPYASIGRDTTLTPTFMQEETRQLARRVTTESIVLLKNSGLLPIDPSKVKRIAVVGPYADLIVQDWYSGKPPYEVTILQALREEAANQGIDITYTPDNRMGEAERLAREADLVVVCTGNHPYGTKADWKFSPVPSDGREAVDRKSLQLPDEDLLRQLYKINPKTVLVLVSSFPYSINWSQENLPAIVHTTHCSQEQGHAVSDVLFGHANPAGRTTQTWPRDILDLPQIMDYDLSHGRTYMYSQAQPLYPFGFGLSYTTFRYGKASIAGKDKQRITISVPVTNTGKRDGDEVVQLYASHPESTIAHPKIQLRAFERVHIKKGETVQVKLVVDRSDLTYWNEQTHQFMAHPGKVVFHIGPSSADLRSSVASEAEFAGTRTKK